ncbi:MAG: hypothetical protein PHO55_06240 [Thiomonas arsenitoxydans]|nr:hypothetical protein [Thiomonas arsenitoxydans]
MARKPAKTENESTAIAEIDAPGLTAAADAATQLAVIDHERAEKVRALATTLHYTGPIHPDALEAVAIEAQRHIHAGLFALGTSLILLRESCEHGDFLDRLDRIGVEPRVAQRSMQLARKFSNAPMSAHLENLGKSKLLELIVLDDEQIEELTATGQTGELALDDLATMSVKDLRNTIRSLRGDVEAKDAVLSKTNEKLTKLQVQLKKKVVADTDWPDALEPISEQIAAAGRKVATGMSELETCRITLFETMQNIPDEERPKFEAALAHVGEFYVQALQQAEKLVSKERTIFDKSLGAYTPEA